MTVVTNTFQTTSARNLVDFSDAWRRLQTTNFRAPPRLVAELLHREALRRRSTNP